MINVILILTVTFIITQLSMRIKIKIEREEYYNKTVSMIQTTSKYSSQKVHCIIISNEGITDENMCDIEHVSNSVVISIALSI